MSKQHNKLSGLTTGGHPMFNELLAQLSDLHARKNTDYAGYAGNKPLSNFNLCEAIGIPVYKGIWIRMSDKWSRILSLLKNEERAAVANETIEDTLMDLAAYSLLMVIARREAMAQATTAASENKLLTSIAPSALNEILKSEDEEMNELFIEFKNYLEQHSEKMQNAILYIFKRIMTLPPDSKTKIRQKQLAAYLAYDPRTIRRKMYFFINHRLIKSSRGYTPTDKGINFYNYIFSRFSWPEIM